MTVPAHSPKAALADLQAQLDTAQRDARKLQSDLGRALGNAADDPEARALDRCVGAIDAMIGTQSSNTGSTYTSSPVVRTWSPNGVKRILLHVAARYNVDLAPSNPTPVPPGKVLMLVDEYDAHVHERLGAIRT